MILYLVIQSSTHSTFMDACSGSWGHTSCRQKFTTRGTKAARIVKRARSPTEEERFHGGVTSLWTGNKSRKEAGLLGCRGKGDSRVKVTEMQSRLEC